jgi:hypothetical protein
LFTVHKVREEWIDFWFYWCFSTNRAHALDLCLIFMSRTHFEQDMRSFSTPKFYKVKVLVL